VMMIQYGDVLNVKLISIKKQKRKQIGTAVPILFGTFFDK
jgi:hypothetical protein